jgi:fructose/tagatose bisphosphate aldolase
MPLVPFGELLGAARRGGYAVGYFEAWDTYSLEAVLTAAELERSPVVLGFGCLLLDQAWLENGGIEIFAALGRAAVERARVPVSLILNEAHTVEHAQRGVAAGFNTVMLATSEVGAIATLAAYAHARGVAVEGELGALPDGNPAGEIDASHAALTDPDTAAGFVAATRVDALAVSVGNVHTLEGARAEVDLDRLERIHRAVDVPLVIHGGTGFPAAAVPAAIARGVAKFNVGTALKRAMLAELAARLARLSGSESPHDLLGSHRAEDLLEAAKPPLVAKVRELMRLYGSSGQAA